MTAPLRLFKKEITDTYTRENFISLEKDSLNDPFRKGSFVFFSLPFPKAAVLQKIPHRLGFRPLDVLTLSVAAPDTATVSWHYDSFDETFVVVSTSGACTVRAYIGRYGDGQ